MFASVSVHNASTAVPSSLACHSVDAVVDETPAYALHAKAEADAMQVGSGMPLVHECSVTKSLAHYSIDVPVRFWLKLAPALIDTVLLAVHCQSMNLHDARSKSLE